MGKAARSSYDHAKVVNRPSTTSTTEELVQLLRQQASTKHNIPSRRGGTGTQQLSHVFYHSNNCPLLILVSLNLKLGSPININGFHILRFLAFCIAVHTCHYLLQIL